MTRTVHPYRQGLDWRGDWDEDFNWDEPVATKYIDTKSEAFVEGKPVENPWKYYFLYGTLKNEHRNNFIMDRENASYMGTIQIDGYGLGVVYDCIPAAFQHPGYRLNGELWMVREPNLHLLDHFEQGYTKHDFELRNYCSMNGTCSLFVWNKPDEVKHLMESDWSTEMERTYLE